MKRFFALFLLFLSLSPLCKKATDGFSLTKTAQHFLDQQGCTLDPDLLNSSFRYLDKGGQAYVFVSEDGTAVLKLFRASRLSSLSALNALLPVFQNAIKIEERRLEDTLKSYSLAYRALKEETGLIAVHLDNSEVDGALKIIDKLGIEHTIDPSRYVFVLQKRAVLVKDQIGHWMNMGKEEKAKEAITALFSLLSTQIRCGIEDLDPNLGKNFGFLKDKPIEIDGGRFRLSSSPSLDRLKSSKENLQHWINAQYPGLSSFFDATYQEWLESYETF